MTPRSARCSPTGDGNSASGDEVGATATQAAHPQLRACSVGAVPPKLSGMRRGQPCYKRNAPPHRTERPMPQICRNSAHLPSSSPQMLSLGVGPGQPAFQHSCTGLVQILSRAWPEFARIRCGDLIWGDVDRIWRPIHRVMLYNVRGQSVQATSYDVPRSESVMRWRVAVCEVLNSGCVISTEHIDLQIEGWVKGDEETHVLAVLARLLLSWFSVPSKNRNVADWSEDDAIGKEQKFRSVFKARQLLRMQPTPCRQCLWFCRDACSCKSCLHRKGAVNCIRIGWSHGSLVQMWGRLVCSQTFPKVRSKSCSCLLGSPVRCGARNDGKALVLDWHDVVGAVPRQYWDDSAGTCVD